MTDESTTKSERVVSPIDDLPPMPRTTDRAPSESDVGWCAMHTDVVRWLVEHHRTIRLCLTIEPPMPATMDRPSGEGYLDWVQRHPDAIRWLIDNQSQIRVSMARRNKGVSTAGSVDERDVWHALNEAMDGLTSALQWLRNVKNGTCTVEDAIANVEWSVGHATQVVAAIDRADDMAATKEAPSTTAVVADARYPSTFYSPDRTQRIKVGHYLTAEGPEPIVRIETLLENKPGGAWITVPFDPDEAEQMALHVLEKVRSARGASLVRSDTSRNERAAGGDARCTAGRLARLEVAARPLAAIADDYSDDEDDDLEVWKDFDSLGASLPLKRFRALRDALAAASVSDEAKS